MAAPELPISSTAFVHANYFYITCPSRKLSDKMSGPFEVVAQPGTHSYTLCLLTNMCLIHPIFHIAMLEPATPNTIPGHIQSLPLPETINGEEHYEITAICDSACTATACRSATS